ncbi:hypothetical protein MRB53_008761 [Persea americana]|uniref:Uncharacterized protein n=1 Tax=Persea americana TaxID=3435 RepID=A0ACC2LM27_PERAE|nr:hypothetical protein MRB53_008761 [Persea americana]
MGDHEGWAEPSGLLLSGLLPNEAASVTRALDMERWLKAEERTAELIACIQPNQPSEERRNAVADYVQRLIMKCFSCEVFTFTFGSVPLKTYLPDGDIDLTAFSMNQNLKDTWAQEVRDMLEKEEKSENAEFRVKEVQYIQAEVKIIKCLVENIVVDISFNQLGGLCTLCFLDEVDHLINQNHLFKRSIILIKAWCYYESRILGAHHGLISTYALETLVLYIFHVFNNSFAGPLEVLYRFLEFFSNFDWENFCVSLWGPVPINSLPEMTAEPPRRDNGELLLSRPFLEFCNLNYAVFPVGQENQGQPFASKHFNVVDPLRTNNNLGRSVSKGNFFRIRSAFAFGAKRLATLLECPKEKLITEIDMFFMNTWERHGCGHRPDAPSPDLWSPRPLNLLPDGVPENTRNHTAIKRKGENVRLTAAHKADGTIAFHGISSQLGDTTNHPPENMSRTSNMPTVSHTQSHTIYSNQNSRRISGQFTRDICSSETMHPEKDQRSSRQDYLVNEHEGQARYHFARTQSSPELADMNGKVLSRGRPNRLHETGKKQSSSGRPDHSGRRKNMGSEASTSHSTRSLTDDPSSLRHSSSHQSLDTAAADSNSVSNSYNDDASCLGPIGEELASVTETTDMQQDMMHQEEQDLINMMASSRIHNFNGQVQVPLNFASAHLPVPVSPAVFASMGYAQRNLTGMVPATNIHLVEPTWGSNAHFMQSLVSDPNSMPRFFPTGLASNSEEISESDNENSGLTELNQDGNGFWNEHEMGPSKGFDPDDGSFQMLQSNKQPLISSRASSSGSSVVRGQHKFVKDNKGPPREDHCYIPQYQNSIGNDYSDRNMNLRFLPVNANSSRSKPVSESSWDGSSMKASRSVRDKRGKKTGPAAVPPASYRKVKTGGWQHESPSSDHISSPVDDDNREWIPLSAMGSTEMAERSTRPLSVATLPVRDHQLSGYEPAQINESDSMMPIAPMLVGSSSRQRTMDNNGVMPFAFYQTGPPVPYLTMLPVSVYRFPNETENTDGSTGHFDRDDGLESSSINQPDQNLNLSESLDQSEIFASSTGRVASVESVEQAKPKPDILNSDFLSHLRNLQYGRLCQTTRNHVPWMYPPSVMVPPVYLQGHFPWDGPGRPLMGNANLFTQLSPRLVAPLQPGFNRPVGVFQRFGDDLPRYRSGTGTYLPNPKVPFRDRHSSTKSHWGNYNYDKNDHHGDRGGNWNFSSKSRPASRNHGRSQPEKPSSRSDRLMAADSRADRPWDSYRLEPMASYQAQNGSFSSANSMHSSANVSYGMYPIPPMDSNSVTPTGPAVPSVVMLYSYDHNGGYGSQAEQLEFGSLGPVHFSGMNDALQLGDSSPMHTMYEHRNSSYQGSSDRSSPDQPSSPQLQRSAAQRNYQLKDEDFPPLSFSDRGDEVDVALMQELYLALYEREN